MAVITSGCCRILSRCRCAAGGDRRSQGVRSQRGGALTVSAGEHTPRSLSVTRNGAVGVGWWCWLVVLVWVFLLAVDGAARPAQKESRADDSKERPFPPLCRPAVPPRSPRSLSRVCLFLQAANGAACLQVRHLTPARRRTLLHRCRGFVLALHGLGFRSTLKIPNPRNRATLPCAQCPLVLMQCVPLPAALVPGWNKPVPRSGFRVQGLGFRFLGLVSTVTHAPLSSSGRSGGSCGGLGYPWRAGPGEGGRRATPAAACC